MKPHIRRRWTCALIGIVAACLLGAGGLSPLSATQARVRESHEKVAPPGSRGAPLPPEVEDLFRRAADLIYKDRPAEAIPLLRKALELAPNEGRIHHYLGWALMVGSQLPAAQREFETALKLEPGNVYSEYFLALTLDMQGSREKAFTLYEAILASGNVIYDTYARLGQAYARKKELNKALPMIQQALRQTPWDGALHYQLANIYRQMGRKAEAEEEFATGERLKRKDQSSIQKVLELSEAVRQKDAPRVSALRRELMSQSGDDPELMTWLGVILGQGGLYTDALLPLQKAAALGPCSYETCYNLGLTLVKLEREQEAEEPLKKALALRPESYEANVVLSIIYVNQNQNREAIERLRAAQQAQPESIRVLMLLGQQYLQGWFLQDAINTFREVLRLKPDALEARYLLIEAYQNDKAYDKALEAARDAVKLYPRDARAHYEIGHQLANLGHYQEGRRYFEEALRLDPSLVEAHVWLGDLNSRSGQYEAALRNFRRARELDPRDMDAVRGVGQSLIRLKRYPEALTELQKSIADYPEDAELYLQLSQVYGRLGKLAEAEQARGTFQKLHALEVKKQDSQRPRTFSP
ncbi:MAG: tetratricopeptide repeat protein [Acidobacteriia bacterium]|nr:tetratricopeptide repeat protein [Terriglobia bacterium]